MNDVEMKPVIGSYPAQFRLRGFPGKLFRINSVYSFLSEDYGPQLVLEVKIKDRWVQHSRVTPAELDAYIVAK